MADAFIDSVAELGSEDEDYENELDRKAAQLNVDDDSSEEEEDDDEEELEKIRNGFIVDEDEEENDSEEERKRRKLRKKKRKEKRKRTMLENEAELSDELEDLNGFDASSSTKTKFKRLKQGHGGRGFVGEESDEDIFDEGVHSETAGRTGGYGDDLEDFIEDDVSGEEGIRHDDDREIARPGAAPRPAGLGSLEASGLDEATYEDMLKAFGDGNDYLWALQLQEEAEAEDEGTQQELELKDVFEPSQLQERMLTEEDNIIRATDVPERFQILRKPFKDLSHLGTQARELRRTAEAHWITRALMARREFGQSIPQGPLEQAVFKVLEFMNEQDLEVPFIYQHRKDYLIHAPKRGDPSGVSFDEERAIQLLDQSDLWDILELDPKFRTMFDKIAGLQDAYEVVKDKIPGGQDDVFEDLIGVVDEVEEVQDLYDHLICQYPALMQEHTASVAEVTGGQKRVRSGRSKWEGFRYTPAYAFVRAFGLNADQFARQASGTGRRDYIEDPALSPEDLADTLLSPPDYSTGTEVLRAGLGLFTEELVTSPRLRRYLRNVFYRDGVINSRRTEQGARLITEDDRYYEFKYLKNRPLSWASTFPHKFLRMLQAEAEGLLTVEIGLRDRERFVSTLCGYLESDNVSDVADSWNSLRRKAVESAFSRLETLIGRSVKERVKGECIGALSKICRQRFARRLDQAPYKPRELVLGSAPNVLAFTNGNGGNDAIVWAYVKDDGRLSQTGKFIELRPGNRDRGIKDTEDVSKFVDLFNSLNVDVIVVGGFTVAAKRLHRTLQDIVATHNLTVTFFDDVDGIERQEAMEVLMGNDECARLFHTSARAERELTGVPPLARYCVGLARYMQSPLAEYAALGRDITSLAIDPDQDLIPRDRLYRALETALVDIVNMVGVDINEAVSNDRVGQLLPFVAGLGPRKAAHLLKVVGLNGGEVRSRAELVGDPEESLLQAVGPRVFMNCASFLYIDYDPSDEEAEFLDSTRVHPEDYDLARKMAADALELDEEDIQAEMDEYGPGAVVRKLVRDEAQDRVNDLVLSEYAEQLYRTFSQLKRATLETIRAELIHPYEEIRQPFQPRTPEEILTMLTGETVDSLRPGTILSVKVRRVYGSHIDVTLSCGLDGTIAEHDFPDRVGGPRGVDPRQVYTPQQAILAAMVQLNVRQLTATLSLNEAALKKPDVSSISRRSDEWDFDLEKADREAQLRAKEAVSGRPQRVINHPLFRPFSYPQAEEFLGSQSRGDLVIRPSSRGLDHLTVTWKVSDNVYQHIDVLELNKENEFSLGKVLKIGGKYTYTDLDELIFNHVKAMAKKVDEMMNDEKFLNLSKQQTEERLVRYTQANPGMIDYAFCINPKYPGYFHLCFKAGRDAELGTWPVKVLPNAFELQRNQYTDVRSLKNGFKLLFSLMASNRREGGGGRR